MLFSEKLKYLNTSAAGFYVALTALFLELVVKSILGYQQCYWGWDDSINVFIYRYVFKVPFFTILIILFAFSIKEILVNRKRMMVLSAIILFVIFIIVRIVANRHDPALREYNLSHIYLIGDFGYFYLIGYFLSVKQQFPGRIKISILAGQILMTLQVLLFFRLSQMSIEIENLKQNSYIHLLLGGNYALWSLLTVSVFRKERRLFIFALCIPFLFFMGSRSALYCFILVTPLLLHHVHRSWTRFVFILAGMLVIALIIFPHYFENHRMLAVLSLKDLSLSQRMETLQFAWADIMNNFLSGCYGCFFSYPPPANTYIHSILSVWSELGFLPFMLMIFLFILAITEIKRLWKFSGDSFVFLIISFTLYFIFLMLIAKSYSYPLFFIMFGFTGIDLTQLKQKLFSKI